MSVPDALALAARYRTAYAGSLRQPAFVRALLALAERLADAERDRDDPAKACEHDTLYREGGGYRCHDCGEMTEYVDPPDAALTAEEWTARKITDEQTGGSMKAGARHVFVSTGPANLGYNGTSIANLPAVIALANAALPDGDPRKITRADVERCRQRAHVLRYGTPWAPKVESMQPSAAELDAAREWDSLAAKLAALLPPPPLPPQDPADAADRLGRRMGV